jgi:hypothetical protein
MEEEGIMASRVKRNPVYFTEFVKGGTNHRYQNLSKADWADAFCDLYKQVFGEQSTPQTILADAEQRVANLKLQGIR